MEKKMYKLEHGKLVDGVCGGIAEYFEIDPTVIRVAWSVFAACGGCGILAYIVCMVIMPRKPSNIIESE